MKFVRQKSDVATALDNLQSFAENLMLMETNRRVQLGREKEARMSVAYNYMIGEEEKQITDLENSLDLITANLRQRGIELADVKPAHRSIS